MTKKTRTTMTTTHRPPFYDTFAALPDEHQTWVKAAEEELQRAKKLHLTGRERRALAIARVIERYPDAASALYRFLNRFLNCSETARALERERGV